jgi:hypothetical protein
LVVLAVWNMPKGTDLGKAAYSRLKRLPAAVNLTPKVAEETVCEIMVPVQHLKNMWQEALRGASAQAGFREASPWCGSCRTSIFKRMFMGT